MNLRALDFSTDERLLVEAAQKDPVHFARLYEANFERVYAYIVRRVGDRDVAQDLTAEVFQQALANIGRFEWRGVPFVGWLLRMAANAVNDRWKQGNREEELPEDIESGNAAEAIEQRAMLFRMVDQLPEEQRTVIVKRFVDQLSTREIAKEMGKTEGAIKQLQFRALVALRAKVRSSHV